jgi:hypothetical protein
MEELMSGIRSTAIALLRLRHRHVTPLMIAALCAAPLALGACAGRNQVYDPYYGDYHRWNGSEDGFYRQWEGETRRTHADFGLRPAEDQRAYFNWRHSH